MDTLTIILNLMQTKKCDNQTLATALNLNRQVVTDWRAGRSKSYTKYLPQIADYFGVSVDYLLGKTEQKEKLTADGGEPVDPKLREALKIMSELPPERQAEAMNYLRFLSNASDNP